MKVRRSIGCVILISTLAVAVFAGPPLACHEFASTPGSALEAIEKLRRTAIFADDSQNQKDAARRRLSELRAAIRPDDPLSLLKAGYWAELLHSIKVSPEADGTTLILKALEMRPNDPEYQFIAALAFLEKDKGAFQKHWQQAKRFSAPGSAMTKNLKVFGDLFPAATH